MQGTPMTIDWATLLPVLAAMLSPMFTGFLTSFNTKFQEKGPWWAKSLLSGVLATLIGMIGSYAAGGDALLGAAGGAVVAGFGSLNIAFRRGPRGNLEVSLEPKTPPAPPTP